MQPSEIDRPVRATWLTHCVLPLLAAGLLSAMPLVVVALPAAIYLLMWMPGRSVLRILGLEHVRGRAILSVAISLVIVPIVLNLVWQHSNSRWVVLGVLVGLNLVLGLAAVRQPTTPAEPLPREGRFALAMILAWTCGLVFLFFWLPTAFDRFAKCPSFDYIKHHAMLYALDRSTLPLINVFYAAERDTPYYYYHYSYLIPASLRIVTGGSISIATAFALSSATIVGMVITIVYLLSLRFWDSPRAAVLSALTASIVGGWDIVPAVIRYVLKGIPLVVLDAWCPVIWRLHSLVDNYIWCPQHIAGIMALLLACYLLTVGGLRWWWVPAAPLLGAYLFGTSIYEAMTTFAAVGVFVLTLLVSRDTAGRRGCLLAALAVIALLGGALMLPQARGYLEMAERYPRGLTASWPRMPFAVFGWLVPPGPLANWLDAPWLLLIEFALPFLAGVFVTGAVWRRFWSDPAQRLLMLSGLAAVLAAYTWRSSVSEIDYGFRTGVMAANAFGAILCGALVVPGSLRRWAQPRVRPVLVVGLLLGAPAGLGELPLMTTRTFWQKRYRYDESAALRYLRDELPEGSVVQAGPVDERVHLPQMIHRQMGVLDPLDPHVIVLRPIDGARVQEAYEQVAQAFTTADAKQAAATFRRWGITHVLVGPVERARFGELPQLRDTCCFEPVFEEPHATVYRVK